jgi:hypothetical protein
MAAEAIFYLRPLPKLAVLGVAMVVAILTMSWLVLRPLYSLFWRRQSPDDIDLALQVGAHFGSLRDRLADALQVFLKHRRNPEGYSLELADASLIEVHKEISDKDFESVAATTGVKSSLKVFAGAGLIFVAALLVFPSALFNASDRLLHPLQEYSRHPTLAFRVSPGNTEAIKGESVDIIAEVQGDHVTELDLFVKKSEADEFERKTLTAGAPNRFSYTLSNLSSNVEYFFRIDPQKSDSYNIEVVELPYVRNLQVKVTYPRYSKLGSQFLDENVGDLSALKGSTIELSASSNKTVQEAQVIFDDGKRLPLKVSGQEITGKFTLMRAGSYRFHLVDKKSRENDRPIEYRMSLQEDQPPLVQITFPGQDVDLGEDLLLPLSIEAEDDFGISKIRLGFVLSRGGIIDGDQQFLDLPLPKEQNDKLLLNHNWELSNLEIQPEDVVSYFAEAFDNDRISGPKSSRSLTYRVRFPSIYEMYNDVARGHEEAFDELQNMQEESKALQEELKQIVQEMKREPELNWQEKQEVQDAVQSQEEMRQNLESIQEQLDEMINQMEQNDLMSMETLEKYRELQQLMQEMLTPELKEALSELQKSMEELDPQKLKDAMEKFASSQEEFLKSVERTLNLLKKLEIEQKMDEVVRKTQDLLRRQDQLNSEAKQSAGKQNQDKYAQEEKGIRKDSDNLSEELDNLDQKMGEVPNMPQKEIQSAQDQMNESGLQSQMDQAIQQFQSGDMQGAQQSGQQISQNLEQMLQSLESAQQQLSEEQKKAVMQALSRSSHDLLGLSKQQEALRQQTEGMDRNSPRMNETADRQQDMRSGLSRVTNQLFDLSQNTFFVTPEIGKALGKSMNGMQESLEGLEGRNSSKSAKGQGQAMSGLNEAVAELRNSMQNLSGSSSSIGFQEMMQRMMGISNQQQGINQQTGEMGQQPGMSMEEQAAMSRLAGEQEALRKSLEQLQKEAGNRSELLGDLERIGEDMQEVVKDFQSQSVSPSTINRQKRILSRLLDAQRSVHNRDFSKKRKAETGKQYDVLSPQALPSDLLTRKDRLKSELLKALKEGYSRDYIELIRKYFDSLSREKQGESLNN